MSDILLWLIAIELIGAVTFPLGFYLLPTLKDHGFYITKPLGLLIFGYLTWAVSQLKIVPINQLSLLIMIVMAISFFAVFIKLNFSALKLFFSERWKFLLATELIFLLFFIAWTIYRIFDPSINHTEQPMDLAFLNASIETTTGSPSDPWFSGESVSYYYFGYWMMGILSEMTSVPSYISYNLSLSLVAAMAAQCSFGLVFSIIYTGTNSLKNIYLVSLFAMVFLGISSNLEGILEFMRANIMGSGNFWQWLGISGLIEPLNSVSESWAPTEFWWWFRASRVINTFQGGESLDYTIQEFPFFSFILGDLHPHVLAIPFTLVFVTFCWSILKSDPKMWTLSNSRTWGFIAVLATVLGGVGFTNMWDLPTYVCLLFGTCIIKGYSSLTLQKRDALIWMIIAALSAAVSFLLFSPYYTSLNMSVAGIGPQQEITTRPIHFFIIWGLPLSIVIPFILVMFWKTTLKTDWAKICFLGLFIAFVPFMTWSFLHMELGGSSNDIVNRLFHIWPLAILVAMSIYTTFSCAREGDLNSETFVLMISALSLILLMGPELLFVKDSFNSRMNTVFKLYYQVWILLSISSGFAVYYLLNIRGTLSLVLRTISNGWAFVVIGLFISTLYYPAAAAFSKSNSFSVKQNLDGLAYVKSSEREIIEYIRSSLSTKDVIVESVGEWSDAGLLSRSTGIPSVLNWPGHQAQWRASNLNIADRQGDIEKLYTTNNILHATTIMDKYNVTYVYVGPREIAKYGEDSMSKFKQNMDTVISNDDATLYKAR
tara:strand:+ start:3975 stop:6281 length:2307 start_codon:yes stop_codon:yes gene_type:complete